MNKQRHGKSQTYIGPALLQYISNVQINVFKSATYCFAQIIKKYTKKISGIFKSVELQAHSILY